MVNEPEPRTVSDRMREMRRRRRERGLVEVRVWVRPEDRGAVKAGPDLLEALRCLHALVWGECPALLREDSGGDARTDEMVQSAIAKAESKGDA